MIAIRQQYKISIVVLSKIDMGLLLFCTSLYILNYTDSLLF